MVLLRCSEAATAAATMSDASSLRSSSSSCCSSTAAALGPLHDEPPLISSSSEMSNNNLPPRPRSKRRRTRSDGSTSSLGATEEQSIANASASHSLLQTVLLLLRRPNNENSDTVATPFGIRRRRRRRRRATTTTVSSMVFLIATLVVTLQVVVVVIVEAAPYDLCYAQMERADGDANGQISSDEFNIAVGFLSGGTVPLIDASIFATFATAGGGFLTVTTLRTSDPTHALCVATFTAILAGASAAAGNKVDASDAKCRLALTIGDSNRDNSLERTSEFPRYANQISGNAFGFGSLSYDTLPAPVQSVFADFAVNDVINIVGSKASETPTPEQAVLFQTLCQHTGIAILSSATATTATSATAAPAAAATTATAAPLPAVAAATTAAPAAAVTAAPVAAAATTAIPAATTAAPIAAATGATPATTTPTTFTYDVCLRMIAFSDQSRDDALSDAEYYTFINRLTSNLYEASGSYAALPPALQTNFVTLAAGATTINVFGSKPGQTATPDDTTRLTNVCSATDVAIQAAAAGGGTPATATLAPAAVPIPGATAAPVAGTTTPGATTAAPVATGAVVPPPDATTAIPYETCTKDMILADLSRDSKLDAPEFVRFVSRTDTTIVPTSDFTALPQALQDVFNVLSNGSGSIDVTGSKPNEQPSAEQEAQLRNVCAQIGTALSGVATPSTPDGAGTPAAPTTTTLPPAPVITSGNVTIVNSFVISNTFRLLAADLQQGPDRDSLNTAYALFIAKVMTNYTNPTLAATTTTGTAAPNATTARRRNLRTSTSTQRRRLPVTGIASGSTVITEIRDSQCSTGLGSEFICQAVFASFVTNFEQMDATIVSTDVTRYTQERIQPFLADEQVAIAPNARIRIEGPADPALVATAPTVPLPPLPSDEDVGSNLHIGRIIGFCVIALFAVGGAYYGYGQWQKQQSKRAPDEKSELEISTNEDEEAMSYGGIIGVESAPSINGSNKPTRTSPNDASSVDDSDRSGHSGHDAANVGFIKELATTAQENQEKVQAFLAQKLRIGKKRNANDDDDIGIMEAGDDFLEVDDFGNYAFDEPYEMVQHAADNAGRDGFDWGPTPGDWGGDAWRQQPNAEATTNGTAAKREYKPRTNDRYDNSGDLDATGTDPSESETSGTNSEFGKNSVASGASGNVGQLEGFVDNGDWAGVMQTAAQLENNLHDSFTSAPLEAMGGEDSHSESESSAGDLDNQDSAKDGSLKEPVDDQTVQTSSMTLTPEERRRRDMYREQVEDLVRKAAPDEIENISGMMDQFVGREAELINTLQTMYARTLSQRRLKAVHKSKAIPERDMRGFATGGAEGSAVIAAASMITPETEPSVFSQEDGEGSQFDQSGTYDDEERSQGSYASGSASYDEKSRAKYGYDEQSARDSRSGSYDDENQEGSFSRSHSGSFDDDQSQGGSFTGSHSGSYDDGQNGEGSFTGSPGRDEGSYSGSRSGSYDDEPRNDEGSYTGSRSGSHVDDDQNEDGSYTGSRSGSHVDDDQHDEGSYSGSRSGSYDDEPPNDKGSFTGSRSGSYDDEPPNDERSYTGSHVDDEPHNDEGSFTGSRSDPGDDEGSFTGSRSGSHVDDGPHNDEGSYTGSRSDPGNDEGSFTGSRSGSHVDDGPHDDEGSFTGSRSDPGNDEGSFTGSRSGSHIDDEPHNDDGSFTGSRSGSHVDDDPDNDEGSFTGSRSGSHDDDYRNEQLENQDGCHVDDEPLDEGSFTGSRSGSQMDDNPNDEGSFCNGGEGDFTRSHAEGSFRGDGNHQQDEDASVNGSHGDGSFDGPNEQGSFTGSDGSYVDEADQNDNLDDHPAGKVDELNEQGSFSGNDESFVDEQDQVDNLDNHPIGEVDEPNEQGSFSGNDESYVDEQDHDGNFDDHPTGDVDEPNEQGSFSGNDGSYVDEQDQDGNFDDHPAGDVDEPNEQGSFSGNDGSFVDEQDQDGNFDDHPTGEVDEQNEQRSFSGNDGSYVDEQDQGENFDDNGSCIPDEPNDEGSFTGSYVDAANNDGNFDGDPSGGADEQNEQESFTGSYNDDPDRDDDFQGSPSGNDYLGDEASFTGSHGGSFSGGQDDEGSYVSGDDPHNDDNQSYSGSRTESYGEEHSQHDGEGEDYYGEDDQQGSFTGSQRDGSHSQDRSYTDGDGSYSDHKD